MKSKIIIILVCIVLFFTAIIFLRPVRLVAIKAAVKAVHLIKGKSSPHRYNAASPVPFQNGAAIFIASSLDRIFEDGKTLLKPTFSSKANISLAKNEYESFQVVVEAQGKELNDVELKISDLIDPKTGKQLDNKNITWRVVGYVQTLEPYYPVKYIGLWPDPLLPEHPVNIKANTTQPFWVTVYADPATSEGDYNGHVSVIADDNTLASIPVFVHVYNFVLPKSSHLKTAFDFYGHITKTRYPQGDNEGDEAYQARINSLNDKYILAMLQYRMDPVLNVDPTSPVDLSNVDRYLVKGLSNFSIGKKGGSFDNNWPHDKRSIDDLFSLYRGYGEDLKLNDMLKYSYIYTWDEGDMGNPQVAKVASMVHRAYPGLKNMVCYHGIWDTADGDDWIKDIDIWTFQIDNFNEQKMRKLQAMGKEMWMYISGPGGTDTPNLALDFDSIDYRIIPWLCWKYDIKGFLYWCVNWWPLVDPFENARNSKWEQNGNGLLFYPGKDGPIESLRMEIFRDGMEDYEYIQLLFEDLKILKRKNLDKKYRDYFNESKKLLTMDNTIAASMSNFTRDTGVLQARRDAIAQKIEEFRSLDLNAAPVINAPSNNFYVRDGGGDLTQCTGTTNAPYPGTGRRQPCAFNSPMTVLGYCTGNESSKDHCQYPGLISGGDTLYIDGDSDIHPGQQAQFEIGFDDTASVSTPGCSTYYPYACVINDLPAGPNSSQRTSIIGTGKHKPQLWGTQRTSQVLTANNDHIWLQSLEITDHDACAYNDPASGCKYNGPYPWGPWALDGLYLGGDDVNLTDVYVHGLGRYGINTGNLGTANFTRVWVIGNGFGGVSTGTSATISGTLTWNQPIIEWNGCVEAYPLKGWIDDPVNYSECFGQNSGGYGDGLAFGNTGHGNAGNWNIIGPGSISFNTQDGLDTLHGKGNGTIQIDKMRFEGNAGNQVKMNAMNSSLTNSIVIGDCGWWYKAAQSYKGFTFGDICRALGDVVIFNVTNEGKTQIFNNTVISNGNIALESDDANATGCNGNTEIHVNNNIILGGQAWWDDTSFNGAGGNSQSSYIYNDGTDGNGSGSCGSLKWDEDYNIIDGTKHDNRGCAGAHDKCGINPGFKGQMPMGTSGGGENTFYQGFSAANLVSLSPSSPAVSAALEGLNYWNNSNDYNDYIRLNPPAIGALEVNSTGSNASNPQGNNSNNN